MAKWENSDHWVIPNTIVYQKRNVSKKLDFCRKVVAEAQRHNAVTGVAG
jgi:hypothetical protein